MYQIIPKEAIFENKRNFYLNYYRKQFNFFKK